VSNSKTQRIALVHDWLLNIGGAEKTLKALHEIFPAAPVYTLFYNKNFTDEFMPNADIRPSFLQKTYRRIKTYKPLTPLFPIAVESIDLSKYDLVISSSVSFSKGLILKPKTRHICYCYSPMRQVWDWHAEYKNEPHFVSGMIISLFQHFFRIWDRLASTRVDEFVAISENVRQRIKKYYRRDSVVIPPPVDLSGATTNYKLQTTNFFLIVSRLFKHKNVGITVEAFNKLEWPLVIVGEGPELSRLKKIAQPNIKFLGYQPDDVVRDYYAGCLGFIMPQEEDFGITPIEAMSFGKPVLALRRGGALEYMREGINGEFFDDPVEEVLADGVRRLKEGIETGKYDPETIKKTAERFSAKRFKREIRESVFPAERI
jgi:glycosyltransferase involved in cell wall biosynthesis